MNASRNCENCRFWERVCGADGECHRRPPVPGLMPVVNKLANETTTVPFSYWAPTKASQWCGEHESEIEYIGFIKGDKE